MFKRFKAKKVERDANRIMSSWGKVLKESNMDDRALFLIVYFLLKQKSVYQGKSLIHNNLACAEYVVASSAYFAENTYIFKELESKVEIALKTFFGIRDSSLKNVKERFNFYCRTYSKSGLDAMINEIVLIIPHDLDKGYLVEYNEDSPLLLIGFSEQMFIEIETRASIKGLIDLVQTELNR